MGHRVYYLGGEGGVLVLGSRDYWSGVWFLSAFADDM